MIQINLLPKEEQIAEPRVSLRLPRARFWAPVLVGSAIFLPLFGIHAVQHAKITSLRADIRAAETEMTVLKPQIERIRVLTAQREDVNLRLSIIQGLGRERMVSVSTVDEVAQEVPDYLWLTRLAQTGSGQLTLEGMAFSNLMIAELMSDLEQNNLFEGVSLVVAERAKTRGGGDQPVLSFTLTARQKP